MDIGKSFTYMFDDDNWIQKVVIGALLVLVSVVPVVNLFTGLVLIGYTLRVLQNVSEGSSEPLPEWDDWGGDWMKGLMVALGGLIYAIPILIVSGISSIMSAAMSRGMGDAEAVMGVCVAGLSCLSAIWGLLIGVVFPAAMIKYAETEEFGAFFRFGDIFSFIKANISNYIVAILLAWVAQIVAGFGVIACVIGVFLTAFWSQLVGVHLLGQVAYVAKGGSPLAAATPVTVATPLAPLEPEAFDIAEASEDDSDGLDDPYEGEGSTEE